MVKEILRKIGLAEEEINIYILLLRKGSSKATLLSKELGIARTTTYRFLESLHKKGLVGANIQNNIKHFYAVDPERLPEIIEEKAEELREKVSELLSIKNKDFEKAKIRGRLLCPENQNFKIAETEEYKILPNELISGISTWTYGNKTALFIWSEPFFVVLINNETVTNNNKKTFDYLWNIAKNPSPQHLQKTKL